jgi:B12-binding domain/radical SAM domain protein
LNIAFIVYYTKDTIYSFNAVVAALETNPNTRKIDIIYSTNKKRLLAQIERQLKSHSRVVIGFSIYSTQILKITKLIKKIRKRFGERVIIIAGGAHPSGAPKDTLNRGVDVVFIGESEDTIIKFVRTLQNKGEYSDIKGIAYYDTENIFHYKKRDHYIDLNQYPPFPLENTRFGAIEIARGCPYACNFCQTSFMMGGDPRYRSIESICKYTKIVENEFKHSTDIRFILPNAFSYGSLDGKSVNLSKLRELLSSVKQIIGKEGRIFFGSFPSEVRPEHVNENTLALIQEYAHNDNIIIGAQSGSQRMLEYCNRGHTTQDIYKAVECAIEFNILPNVDFIFGLPGEKEEDRHQTITFMKSIIKMGARIHAHFFIPLPGTPFADASVAGLDKKTKKFLKNYNFKGKVYGNWREQEKLAKKLMLEFKS